MGPSSMYLAPQSARVFQHEAVPLNTSLAGLSALVNGFGIRAPLRELCSVSEQQIRDHVRTHGIWKVYEKRYKPDDSVEGHLNFAMRYESVDLLVLKRIFDELPADVVPEYVRKTPGGIFQRRLWFLYEFLTHRRAELPDAAKSITAVDALDTDRYITRPGRLSKRHRIKDNLLGTAGFCPIIRRTKTLEHFIAKNLSKRAREIVGKASANIVSRAASFLLLADSQASFEIEKERPPRRRIEKWGKAVIEAGKHSLSLPEILRLHGILIDDPRFSGGELRTHGVFIGDHTAYGDPVPEFIGAAPNNLDDLITALIKANLQMKEAEIDPVLQATATAFGFVYIHPFRDGNGRLHRCLIHQVLAERRFTPPGILFPVSSAMLAWIDKYQQTLQSHSQPLMSCIDWIPTPEGNVEVTNETADLYRYFDCTEAAEFLYSCVERTVETDLPQEIDYLKRRDEALKNIMNLVDMPNHMAEQFVLYTQRNGGKLPNKRRKEFNQLTNDEVEKFERLVQHAFDGFKYA